MQTTDFERFRAVMNGMAKVYERELDTVLLDAYWLALGDWSLSEFEAACGHLMRTSEFMPRPAAFTALRNAGRETPGEAWQRVIGHCASGNWRNGLLGDAAIDSAVMALGGYNVVAHEPQDKLGFLQNRFVEHYAGAREANDARQAVPQVTRMNASALPLHEITKQLK